jgi:hypothetical protein
MQIVCKWGKNKKGLNLLKPLPALREPDWIRTNDLLLRSFQTYFCES